MTEPTIKEQINTFIEEESSRIEYGKLYVEVTVLKGRPTNIQAYPKRSLNLNTPEAPKS